MKKYILICLLTSATILTPMQTYAFACGIYWWGGHAWHRCMSSCEKSHTHIFCL